MRIYACLLIIFLSSSNYAVNDSLWIEAEQYLQKHQYEKAARLYEELGVKSDENYKAINSDKVNDLRKVYSIDELELANNRQQNRVLRLSRFILPILIVIAAFFIYLLVVQRKKLVRSRQQLLQAQKSVEESIRNKSLLISNMSHEIRTPLTALSGFSELLTTSGIDEETRRQCNDIIQRNSRFLLNLINDVVDISCLDLNNMKFNLKPCETVGLCKDVILTLEGIKQTAAEISFETELTALEIETDPLRLQQVLINILVNATKFTKEGSIVLRLVQNEAGMAQFSVTDTGCGIPLAKQRSIFERFERVNEKSQGSGIGLSICQLIINRLGGEIWIDSEYTAGCRFIFTHPLKQEEQS